MYGIDIFTTGLRPFPENLMDRIDALQADDYNPALLIQLCILYMERLVSEDTGIQFPAMEVFSIRAKTSFIAQNAAEMMDDLSIFLAENLVRWSSFEMENVLLDGLEQLCEIGAEDLTRLDPFKRRELIWNYREQLLTWRQQELFRFMPEPLLDCLGCSYSRGALYFSSALLGRYLDFAEKNAAVIRQVFPYGHECIGRAMECLAYPAEPDWIQVYTRKAPYYMVGFGYGIDMDDSFTFKDMNWNFYVALYVLEKLLRQADRLLGFSQKGNGYVEE